MAKITLDDKGINNLCEHISHSLSADFLVASQTAQARLVEAITAALKKRKERDIPQPEFLRKMVVKALGNTDGNGSEKRN